jgi:acyl carrier protein
MNTADTLHQLLTEFFDLPSNVRPEDITQQAIPAWDSLASVQLIAELQNAYHVDFDVEEIESLRSYNAISTALRSKAASVYQLEPNSPSESR